MYTRGFARARNPPIELQENNPMAIVYYLVITLHVIACLFLVAVVLLQQGKSQDLASAFGGGGTQTAFGPRGSANVLSRATTVLAGVFMITSLGLSMMRPHSSSILDQVPAAIPSASPAASTSPAAGAPPAATVPVTTAPAAAAPVTTAPAAAAPATTVPAAPAATTPASPRS
jgi:preprotein translocase subunit SecG